MVVEMGALWLTTTAPFMPSSATISASRHGIVSVGKPIASGCSKDFTRLAGHKANHPDSGILDEDVCLAGYGSTDKPGYPVFGKNIGSLCQA